MDNFSYEKGYYIVHSTMLTYYQRLWSAIFAPVSDISKGKYTDLFDKYYESKKARHVCLICNAAPTDEGHIVITVDNPGTAKYICEEHFEILLLLENLRKL